MVTLMTDEEEYQKQINENTGKLVVVDFYADWCGPCKMIAPKIEKMAEEYKDVVFLKVNVDDLAEVAEANGVQAMPTFMFFKDGKKVGEVVGASEQKVEAKVKELK